VFNCSNIKDVFLVLPFYGFFCCIVNIGDVMMFVADRFLTEAYADEEAVAIICSEHCACLNLPSLDVHVRCILNLFRLILIF
jgi:formylmethanofuran dehydrogenase subunit E